MTFVSFNSNSKGVTCGKGTAIPSGALEFVLGFSGVRVARYLVFCVIYCISLHTHCLKLSSELLENKNLVILF